MTMEEHSEIFAKEALNISDIAKLFDLAYPTASEWMRKAKIKLKARNHELRIDIQGRLHVLDYYDFIGVSPDRYSIKQNDKKEGAV